LLKTETFLTELVKNEEKKMAKNNNTAYFRERFIKKHLDEKSKKKRHFSHCKRSKLHFYEIKNLRIFFTTKLNHNKINLSLKKKVEKNTTFN
jgi:hypothetical protein